MNIKRNNDREREVLISLYANKANSIKYLPFFFKDKKEVRRFFNMFGGKTLKLPDTYEEFLQYLLNSSLDDKLSSSEIGIDDAIHERTKNRIVESYLLLYNNLHEVIESECKNYAKENEIDD